MHDKDIELLTHLKDYVMPIKDKIPLYTDYGDFYTNARVGELFALIPQSQKHLKNPQKGIKSLWFFERR